MKNIFVRAYRPIIAALLVAFVFTFTSCDELDDPPPREYTVTFNSNGGSSVDSKTVKSGEKVSKPTDPTRAGFSFDGWYEDNNSFNEQWNFDIFIVTENITLYAKWNEVAAVEFVVTFNTNGGSDVDPQTVAHGAKAEKPDDPERDGFTFEGWYKEATFATEWNFETDVVTENVTLYAKWEEEEIVPEGVKLLKAINHYRAEDNSECMIYEFVYDDQNRISKIYHNPYWHDFYYDDDAVEEHTFIYDNTGFLISVEIDYIWDFIIFNYEKNEDEQIITTGGFSGRKNIFSFPSGNQIISKSWSVWDDMLMGETNYYFTNNGNLAVCDIYDVDWGSLNYEYNEYDDKNSPFKNCNMPVWWLVSSHFRDYGIKNNPVNIGIITPEYTEEVFIDIEYTYDSDGFPLTSQSTEGISKKFIYTTGK